MPEGGQHQAVELRLDKKRIKIVEKLREAAAHIAVVEIYADLRLDTAMNWAMDQALAPIREAYDTRKALIQERRDAELNASSAEEFSAERGRRKPSDARNAHAQDGRGQAPTPGSRHSPDSDPPPAEAEKAP